MDLLNTMLTTPKHTHHKGIASSVLYFPGHKPRGAAPAPYLFFCCFLMLLTSTSSSADSTPTAPPQKDATMGSTCASCDGRFTDCTNSR